MELKMLAQRRWVSVLNKNEIVLGQWRRNTGSLINCELVYLHGLDCSNKDFMKCFTLTCNYPYFPFYIPQGQNANCQCNYSYLEYL